MSTPKSPTPRELYELKQQAIRYYEDNGVPQKIEEILNSMFYENPDDVYGHITNYFNTYAKEPVISKVSAQKVFDCRGQPTLQTSLYCTVRNNEKHVASDAWCTHSVVPEHASPEEQEKEEECRVADTQAAIDYINGPISDALVGVNPISQAEADSCVYSMLEKMHRDALAAIQAEAAKNEDPPSTPKAESITSKGKKSAGKSKGKGTPQVVIPDEPPELFHPGSNAVSSVSTVFCQAGALITDTPLYRYIGQLHCGEAPTSFSLPCPMVAIMSSGRCGPGKSNCVKEYMVVPKPGMPAKQSVAHILSIYNAVNKSMILRAGSAKGKKGSEPAPSRLTNDLGATVPTLDRPEQAIEMIQDAITQIGLTPGEDFHIALNCAAHEVFDHEKGKYEPVLGVQKEGDGMVEFWEDIVTRFPAVIALIDPMRKQDKESWMRLCDKISDRCYIMGDHVYHRPGLLKDAALTRDFRTSGIVLRLEHMTTLSDLMATAKKMTDADNQVAVGSSLGETNSTLLVDMAVGIGARFIITGAPMRGERVAKLNRLIQLESELEDLGCLSSLSEHTFPPITPPTPAPEENPEGDVDGADSESKKK